MNRSPSPFHGSPRLMLLAICVVCGGGLLGSGCEITKARKRAQLAESIANFRQVKLALDSFAMDFDGQYPNADTQAKVWGEAKAPAAVTSNDYFQQLFASGNTQTERIFWKDGASVCSKNGPDDVISVAGKITRAEILKAGDCGIAYVLDQTNIDNPNRPILVDAYLRGKSEFDNVLHDGVVVVLRIDSSSRPEVLDLKGKVRDKDGADLLTTSNCWAGTPPTIVQPAQ